VRGWRRRRLVRGCQPRRGERRYDPIRRWRLGDSEASAADREQALLDYAECMRDHGIDIEDTVFEENGQVQISAPARNQTDDEDFQAAQEQCNQEVGTGPDPASSSVPEDGDE
jgi:hypothetical protein